MKKLYIEKPVYKISNPVNWPPPPIGFKFNVDGSARGKPGLTGIRGILWDMEGKVHCLFSFLVGSKDSNMTKILAIQKACQLCALNTVLLGSNITIVSDSKVVVSWVNNNDGVGSLKHVDIIYDFRCLRNMMRGLSIEYNSRATNSLAENLAKMGSNMEGDIVVWGD
ncbi:hypothetical protein Dsin_002174 [Dipteronia sinensis]|uniref:RNase H type-1 domain-containing protein n=1 Tax=Dipteronia sinensis TaxID=43782 RepID=A0AAE0B5B8_9ROSI|nr:hypothetical protein Dsin_002174 [Dipteronia sinensis]